MKEFILMKLQNSGMNSQHFVVALKTGKTPMEFLNIYRIEQACVYLCESELTVEIALQCGFISLSFYYNFPDIRAVHRESNRKERRNPHFTLKIPLILIRIEGF